MSSDESFVRLQNALATLAEMGADHEQRISRMEQAYVTVVEMIRRHDERVDEFRATRDETEQKLAALADAQIRAGEEMTRVRGAMAELAEAMASLTRKVDAITGAGPSSP
jgi:chromosome segregation ATPase